jgi:hypothetical protein
MARHVFHMPVKEMLTRIDSYELTEWMAYFTIEKKEREKEDKRREAESKGNAGPKPGGSKEIKPDIPPMFSENK